MGRTVQRRRGTATENDAFTGADGEIVVDTDNHTLRVHDGVKQGGYILPNTEYIENNTALTLDGLTDVDTVTVAPAVNDGLIWDGTNWTPGAVATAVGTLGELDGGGADTLYSSSDIILESGGAA